MTYDGKLKLRRRVAKTCFGIIAATFPACILFILFGDGNMRENLSAVTGIVIVVLTFCTGIIGGYMGTTAHQDHHDKKGSYSDEP